eukprot:9364800-Alexandrium_andersonii.AAC.1
MSASLVGSEMCIRDSSCLTHPPLPLFTCPFPPTPQEAAADFRVQLQLHVCLLYTSDAADDM